MTLIALMAILLKMRQPTVIFVMYLFLVGGFLFGVAILALISKVLPPDIPYREFLRLKPIEVYIIAIIISALFVYFLSAK